MPTYRKGTDQPDHAVELALLGAIVESSDDAIVSKTLDGIIESWNEGAARIFGYTATEAIGQPITLIIPQELHGEERYILEQVRQGNRVDHYDTIRVAKDGRRIPISLTVSPIRDIHGVIVGASKVARDISDRKRAETLAVAYEDALRDAVRRKDEFMALLAHELRNLLAPIRYALAASGKESRTPAQQHRDEIIERQVTHMSRLLDDLLDVARITRGSLEIKRSPTELNSVLGAAIETARPLIDARCHQLLLDLPEHDVRLNVDAVRIAQVFSNLLINAAKYTDPGGQIKLRATAHDGELRVSVSDNGIGIIAEMMPHIFTIFSQSPRAISRAEGGLGIGLSLVRGIVDLHGGTIEARSEGVGRGSEFLVRLPLELQPKSRPVVASDLPDAALSAGLKILVVDDNRDAADMCAAMLEAYGHQIQTAYHGTEALELAERFRPQAMVLDISLPGLDGYSLARKLRERPWATSAILIAVSGWGREEDQRRSKEAGFDYHLMKPVSSEAIESLLRPTEGASVPPRE
jgi:PAS domain S-box-containing protein